MRFPHTPVGQKSRFRYNQGQTLVFGTCRFWPARFVDGMAVRPSVRGGIRLTIRTKRDDERLLDVLGSLGGV